MKNIGWARTKEFNTAYENVSTTFNTTVTTNTLRLTAEPVTTFATTWQVLKPR